MKRQMSTQNWAPLPHPYTTHNLSVGINNTTVVMTFFLPKNLQQVPPAHSFDSIFKILIDNRAIEFIKGIHTILDIQF